MRETRLRRDLLREGLLVPPNVTADVTAKLNGAKWFRGVFGAGRISQFGRVPGCLTQSQNYELRFDVVLGHVA